MKFFTPIILLALSAALFFWYINPHYQTMNTLIATSSAYDDAIKTVDQVVAKKDQLRSQYQSFSDSDTSRLMKVMPDSTDNIKLIIDVNNIAARSGSKIKDIKVASVDSQAQKQNVSAPTTAYGTVGMNFGVSLSYDQFRNLLSNLESNLRLTDIQSIDFKPSDTSSTYDFSVALSTYWLK